MPTTAVKGEALAIIVNKSNPIYNVSLAELRKIVLVEQTHWSNGRKITIVMREPGQVERSTVLHVIYRMSEREFTRYFLRASYTGENQTIPKTLATAAGVRKFILNVPGGIGFVRASEVDDSVKVLTVDGRAPGEGGYPLTVQE
jgi:ABC-type phosphate transport system substrate-binding protein